MIYIVEGADGTGKSTLSRKLLNKTKGHYLHSSYDPSWNIEDYHKAVFNSALRLSKYQDVIIDRWAPSEMVYGLAFRNGPSYNVLAIIDLFMHSSTIPVKWIMCRNDNAVENHLKNKKKRDEMFESMEKVPQLFDNFVDLTSKLDWIFYDYDKKTFKQLWEELHD